VSLLSTPLPRQDEPKPAIAIAQAACDSSDIWWMAMKNAWQRVPLWPHRMGPIIINCAASLRACESAGAFFDTPNSLHNDIAFYSITCAKSCRHLVGLYRPRPIISIHQPVVNRHHNSGSCMVDR